MLATCKLAKQWKGRDTVTEMPGMPTEKRYAVQMADQRPFNREYMMGYSFLYDSRSGRGGHRPGKRRRLCAARHMQQPAG